MCQDQNDDGLHIIVHGEIWANQVKVLTSPLLIGYSLKSFGYSLNFYLK
jgi:hypothetical protein